MTQLVKNKAKPTTTTKSDIGPCLETTKLTMKNPLPGIVQNDR